MVKSALDIAANPILVDSCPESVAHCRKEVGVNASDVGDHGKVEGKKWRRLLETERERGKKGWFTTTPPPSSCSVPCLAECLKRLFRDRALGRFGDRPHCIVEVAKLVETESMDIEVGGHQCGHRTTSFKFCKKAF